VVLLVPSLYDTGPIIAGGLIIYQKQPLPFSLLQANKLECH